MLFSVFNMGQMVPAMPRIYKTDIRNCYFSFHFRVKNRTPQLLFLYTIQ